MLVVLDAGFGAVSYSGIKDKASLSLVAVELQHGLL